MASTERRLAVTRTIAASAAAIFEVLATPSLHSTIDGSGSVGAPKSAPDRLSLGARFTVAMRLGIPYQMTNVVTVFQEGRAIAWHHVGGFTWRYDLVPIDGGTEVTESFDYRGGLGVLLSFTTFPARNRQAMAATLERLERVVTANEGLTA